MKKKYKIFQILILLFLIAFNSSKAFATKEQEACQAYYEAVRNSEDGAATSNYGIQGYDDFGFMIKEKSVNNEWVFDKSEDGFFKVGHIYSLETLSKINSQDLIIRINGKELKDVKRLYNLENDKEKKEITLELLNQNNDLYKVTLKKDYNSFNFLKHFVKDIYVTDINIKKGTFEISLNEAFQFFYTIEDNYSEVNHVLHRLAQGNIIYKVENSDEYLYHICSPTKEQFAYSYLMDPSEIRVLNLIKSDKDLENIKYKITPYDQKIGNEIDGLRVEVTKISTLTLKNYFNLRSFPFDKQKLIYTIADDAFVLDKRLLMPREQTYETLDKFINKDDIPGWNKIKYEINLIKSLKIAAMEGQHNSGIEIAVFLERKSGYYVFKVIFPIILILMVCWSVVWIHPRELESRLTITIVCLLSLIAYNFVIDAELPKLEYLTVLDWIILLSYVYAAIPNFLTIMSFKFFKSNEVLSNKIEHYGKRFGPTSYLLFVLIMTLVNANKNPDNTGGLLSFLVGQ